MGMRAEGFSRKPTHTVVTGSMSARFRVCRSGRRTLEYQVAVGTAIADRPPHRSVRAELPHTAPA